MLPHFLKPLDNHGPGGHVYAERQRLGSEHHLEQAVGETVLHALAKGRDQSRVVSSHTGLQSRGPRPVSEHAQFRLWKTLSVLFASATYLDTFFCRREPHTIYEELLYGVVTAGTTEDEDNYRKHVPFFECFDHLEPAW